MLFQLMNKVEEANRIYYRMGDNIGSNAITFGYKGLRNMIELSEPESAYKRLYEASNAQNVLGYILSIEGMITGNDGTKHEVLVIEGCSLGEHEVRVFSINREQLGHVNRLDRVENIGIDRTGLNVYENMSHIEIMAA